MELTGVLTTIFFLVYSRALAYDCLEGVTIVDVSKFLCVRTKGKAGRNNL